MEINRFNIIDILKKLNIRPDKDYGQNFLLEPNIAQTIVSSLEANENDLVLEVGPGLGSLTNFLLLTKAQIDVCDIDYKMIDFLKVFYQDKLHYICDDVRKIDVSNYNKIIGNLPYNITTELIEFLILHALKCQKMVLMIQLEAFNRFNDLSGENYGAISVLTHMLFLIKKILVVKPGSFHPVPKCKSIVFSFKKKNDVDYECAFGVYKLAKSLFSNRRKTIFNNLKSYLSNENTAKEILAELNLNPLLRPENISPEKYVEMYLLIQKYII